MAVTNRFSTSRDRAPEVFLRGNYRPAETIYQEKRCVSELYATRRFHALFHRMPFAPNH